MSTRIKNKTLQSMLAFWNEYKRYKGGVFGVAIILFILFLSLFGPYISEPNPTLFKGTHAPLAAPVWMGIFDPNYFPDQYLIDDTFQSQGEVNDWVLSVTSSEFFNASLTHIDDGYDDPGSLCIQISDNVSKEVPLGESPRVTVSVKKSFTWKYGRPPNLFRARVDFSGDFLGDNPDIVFAGVNAPYTFRWALYIGIEGMSVSELVDYVSIRSGVQLIYGIDYDSHGIFVGSIRMKDITTTWKRTETSMQREITNVLFEKDAKLYIKLVLTYQIVNPDLRQQGTFRFKVDSILNIGYSYYYGLMGTNEYGADLFALIVDGAKISLFVGFVTALLNISVGVFVGLVAGYYGGKIDEILMRIVDFIMSIPGLPILIVLVFILDQMNVSRVYSIIIVLTVFGWIGPTRIIRSQVLSIKNTLFIEAARASGATNLYILVRHILPNVLPLVFIYVMTGVTSAILSEASLSFLGLGPDWNSWGKILQMASIGTVTGGSGGGGFGAWWYIFFPGFLLSLLGIAFMFVSTTLDTIFNPKRKGR